MSSSYSAKSKQSEYRTYSSKGNIDDREFGSELLPAKYGSLIHNANSMPAKNKEFYYEYSEEKNPAGTYDRKDLHTVEQYEFSNNQGSGFNHSNNLAIANSPHNRVVTTTNRDLSHNIEELDSLLDDLQKDQDRKMYKGGYSSDTMETSSFDYRSTLPKDSEWLTPKSSVTKEIKKEYVNDRVTEIVKGPIQSTVPLCDNCQHTTQAYGTPMNKVTTTVKTYTYEVPADQDPSTLPIPGVTSNTTTTVSEQYPSNTTVTEKYVTHNRDYQENNRTYRATHEDRVYANTHFNNNTSTPVKQPAPAPISTTPDLNSGCQYCSHCNSRITTTNTMTLAGSPSSTVQYGPGGERITTTTTRYATTSSAGGPGSGNQGPPYPAKGSPTYAVPADSSPHPGPHGPSTYKYTTTNYSYNTTDGRRPPGPGPFPGGNHNLTPSPSPFPRNESPAPRMQEPPKRLDDLLADFPATDRTTTDEGLRYRPNPARGPDGSINGGTIISREEDRYNLQSTNKKENNGTVLSKNIEGPAVYYPPGHEMFARKEELAYQQAGGGGMMKAKGKYQYEAKSSSKSKSSSTEVKAVPVCLPLCCAMPCTIL